MTRIVFIGILLFSGLFSLAQQDSSALIFQKAKELEASGNRKEARRQMEGLVQMHPGNLDFGLFNAQLKAFDNEFKEAIRELLVLQQKSPAHYDILFALSDISRWDGQYELSLRTVDSLAKYYPKDKQPAIKKALVYEAQQNNDAAVKILEDALKRFPGDAEILEILNRIQAKNYKQHVGVFYYNTVFLQAFAPWHFGGVEYMRKTKFAPMRFIASVASRYQTEAVQLEAEAYPKLGRKSYLYAQAGFSTGKGLFPDWRSSLELYHSFPHKWEASLGFRNLNYISKLGKDNINFVFTGTIGKYFPKYWLYYRSYAGFGPQVNGSTFSHLVHIRRYLKDEDRFIALNFIRGANPMFIGWLNQFDTYMTSGVGADYQLKWKNTNLLKISLLYEREEYLPATERDRVTTFLTYLKRF